ncbi:PREDICTED: general transcription factor II-I repeat domain-containing protein 2B-like [Habropoda laboriosa]|uniref:general transcription factor II-I repeat domain-containing protein 2B-like n=1 Tax=Habropoda laboriosa TaxID=597456 RepID=UPI00083D69FE|nr:PREDICTED: general transcription factor II-I repeat domain-containing protein 2B-like [Habropoda laboriosa]
MASTSKDVGPKKRRITEELRSFQDRRVDDIGKHIEDNLKSRASEFIFYALALNESTEMADTAQLAIFIRGVDIHFKKTEELAALYPLKDTTKSRDLLEAVTSALNRFSLQLNNLSGLTTDGAPAMVGKHEGLVKLNENEASKVSNTSMLNFHCIIHRENLCSKSLKMDHVMKVVVKIEIFIKSNGLNHRQFQIFLKSLDSDYNDVTFYAEVRWLTCAKMLKRVFDLQQEIQSFFASKSKSIPEFEDKEWVCDFTFLVDITSHLNDVNTRLQGKDQLINKMYDHISAFQMKLGFWEQQLKTKNFTHFPTLSLQPDVTQEAADKYAPLISHLNLEFENRFQDFEKHHVLFCAFATPFAVDVNLLPGRLQMEHCEMCCDTQLKEKFHQVGLGEFYKTYLHKDKYPAFYKHALSMVSLFGNTYACEQLFSRMKHIKSQVRTRITDVHLENCLDVATTSVEINFDALSSVKQSQMSHF